MGSKSNEELKNCMLYFLDDSRIKKDVLHNKISKSLDNKICKIALYLHATEHKDKLVH